MRYNDLTTPQEINPGASSSPRFRPQHPQLAGTQTAGSGPPGWPERGGHGTKRLPALNPNPPLGLCPPRPRSSLCPAPRPLTWVPHKIYRRGGVGQTVPPLHPSLDFLETNI